MGRLFCIAVACMLFQTVAVVTATAENGRSESKIGAYLVKEGRVEKVITRSLVIDGNQYPVSIFVKVYLNSERGVEMPMHAIANTGKIDKARIYLLGGKVEKIIVLKNI